MKKSVISLKGTRDWQGIPGIEIAPNGRLWATFYSGGKNEPQPENFILIMTSSDGLTWTEPKVLVDLDKHTRAYDPTLWHAPNGKLWLIYNQSSIVHRDYSVWATVAEDSGDENTRWSGPRKLELNVPFAFRMNKPIVNAESEWILPVTWSKKMPERWMALKTGLQGVAISSDEGTSWNLFGEVKAPPWALENMVVELKDQSYRYWMLIRTNHNRIFQSFSNDGKVWTQGKKSRIRSRKSRFFISRLSSGRLLLINNVDKNPREGMYCALSENEGKSFPYRLVIETRKLVSYPDAVQDQTGKIHIVYDRDRKGDGEINYITITESEILNCKVRKIKEKRI